MSAERYFRPFVAKKLMAKQQQEDVERRIDVENSNISNFTIRQIFTEIGNTFNGISVDVFQNKRGAKGLQVFTVENRLRGIGMACVILSISFLAVEALNR